MGYVTTLIHKAMRLQKLPSKSALARELGCALTRLNEWERGDRGMPLPRVTDLAKLAGVDPAKAASAYVAERIKEGHHRS